MFTSMYLPTNSIQHLKSPMLFEIYICMIYTLQIFKQLEVHIAKPITNITARRIDGIMMNIIIHASLIENCKLIADFLNQY